MNTEAMIRELNAVAEKHKNDFVPTFQTNITAMCRDIIPKLEKLKEYEDLEEQGELLRLPCKVGEPVYYIQGNCEGAPKEMMFVDRTFFNLNMISKIGTEFFLTQEQAELALQGMKEREGENNENV